MSTLFALEECLRATATGFISLINRYDSIPASSYELESASSRLLKLRLQSI